MSPSRMVEISEANVRHLESAFAGMTEEQVDF